MRTENTITYKAISINRKFLKSTYKHFRIEKDPTLQYYVFNILPKLGYAFIYVNNTFLHWNVIKHAWTAMSKHQKQIWKSKVYKSVYIILEIPSNLSIF